MAEILCMMCRLEHKIQCPIEKRMTELQKRVPKQIKTEKEYRDASELMMKESEIHRQARSRGCVRHNRFTLTLPLFEIPED